MRSNYVWKESLLQENILKMETSSFLMLVYSSTECNGESGQDRNEHIDFEHWHRSNHKRFLLNYQAFPLILDYLQGYVGSCERQGALCFHHRLDQCSPGLVLSLCRPPWGTIRIAENKSFNRSPRHIHDFCRFF